MDRRVLPMDPFREERGWERGTDAEEIRGRVAAVRHNLLSEFNEATRAMVILPGCGDLQTAQGAAHEKWQAALYYLLRQHPIGWPWPYWPTTEAERIYRAIQELRAEIWTYRDWGVKISAEEHRFTEMLKTVLDRADKFLHGQAQVTKGGNTLLVSHKLKDFLKSLNAISDEVVQISGKTSPKQSSYITNGSYPLYAANCAGVRAAGCIMEGLSVQNYIADPYESGGISEKPKPQLPNSCSAECKGVHGLTGAEPENHCVFFASTDPIEKMEFLGFHCEDITRRSWADSRLIRETFIRACSVVHVDLPLIQINTCIMGMMRDIDTIEEVALHKDQTSSVEREASSFVQFSIETSPKGGVDIKIGSYKIHVPKYGSVQRPIVQLPPSARIMECVTAPYIVVDRYETGHTYEKTKPQSANTGSAFKYVHGVTDAEPENHGTFLASTDPIDKMEGQPWRDSTLMSWAARQILLLACLYASVMFTLRTWTTRILGDPTDPLKYEDQTSFVGSEVRTISIFYIPGVIHVWLIYAPKFQSVHHRPLVQIAPFACTLYDGTLACAKSIVPKSIIDLYELGCINQKPRPQSTNPNVDKLTHAEPENHGALDSADCGITEAKDKTAATWLIDTGAVHHATGKLSLLSDVTTVNDNDLFITARDGVRMRVHAQGSVVTDTVVLPDVWYIPGLTKNVVSASQLNQLGYSIGFTRGTCFIRNATDGNLIGKGHVSEDGLFETDFVKVS